MKSLLQLTVVTSKCLENVQFANVIVIDTKEVINGLSCFSKYPAVVTQC